MDIKQEFLKFVATLPKSHQDNLMVSFERSESNTFKAFEYACQLSNSDGYAVAGYVSKLPVTNPQSIRPDANDAFQVPVYTAAPTPDVDRLDAMRYRWLRDKSKPFEYLRKHDLPTSINLDTEVDRAMKNE